MIIFLSSYRMGKLSCVGVNGKSGIQNRLSPLPKGEVVLGGDAKARSGQLFQWIGAASSACDRTGTSHSWTWDKCKVVTVSCISL